MTRDTADTAETADTALLCPLPDQAEDVPWPDDAWPRGPLPEGLDLDELMRQAFDPAGPLHQTYAVVMVHRGRLVYERYAGELPQWDKPAKPVTSTTPLLSWSMAKSMLHAVVGMLVGDGRLNPDDRAAVPLWSEPGDPRHAITIQQLLEMRDGLDFAEEYVHAESSDVIEMLFGRGQPDMAAFAADRQPAAAPGARFNYSSGASNIVSGIVARLVGSGAPYEHFLSQRLFEPLGMRSATVRCDEAGTWIASSYVYATARDFARFGLLYLRDGVWDGRQLLPRGWVDHGRRPRSIDQDGDIHGAHWWSRDHAFGRFWAAGHEGQFVDICPELDLVLVRMGRTDAGYYDALKAWRTAVIEGMATALEMTRPLSIPPLSIPPLSTEER